MYVCTYVADVCVCVRACVCVCVGVHACICEMPINVLLNKIENKLQRMSVENVPTSLRKVFFQMNAGLSRPILKSLGFLGFLKNLKS